MRTVKQLAALAGVSVRTLHHYDAIGLLAPSHVGDNGYRYYDEDAVIRLQQILFFRELGFSLREIQAMLDQPGFDVRTALQTHREALAARIRRLTVLMHTIDLTIAHLAGEAAMSDDKQLFDGFSEDEEKQYYEEAKERWDEGFVTQTYNRWNSYSPAQQEAIKQEGGAIYQALADNMDKGPDSPEVRALLVRWHEHLRNFYEPSIEMLGGLGDMYHDDPAFNETFTKIDPALPAFLKQAIALYVDELETKWLQRELGILEDEE